MSSWFRRSMVMGMSLGALCAAACGNADDAGGVFAESPSAEPGAAGAGSPLPNVSETPSERAGQTGSPGADECAVDSECDTRALEALSFASDASFSHRSARCDQGNCLIVYTSSSGCAAELTGPFFDCQLADAEIFERHRDAISPDPSACAASADPNAACAGDAQPAPQFFPRDPSEWQGMLIESTLLPTCEQSAYCGLARACVGEVCTRCVADADCASGEGCVLDHCVRQELIECRRAAECGSGGLCLLSGYTGGTARGNEDMRAYCSNGGGGGVAGASSTS